MRHVVRAALIALLSVIGPTSPGLTAEGEPTAIIKQTTTSVLEVLENPQLQGPEKRDERQGQLRDIADRVFDWQEIARRALAMHWRERTPQEQKEFVDLFKELVQRAYMSRLEGAVGERKDILYVGEQEDGSRATVKTKVVTKRSQEVPIEYRLHQVNGRWQIYDAVIEGVSLVANYRSQFNRILVSSSYQELIRRLKAKQVEEPAPPSKEKPAKKGQ